MPLSVAERQRRCRLKKKQDKDKYEEYLQKARDRYHKNNTLVKDMNDREKTLANRKWKIKQKKYRDKQKEQEKTLEAYTPTPSPPASPIQELLIEEDSELSGSDHEIGPQFAKIRESTEEEPLGSPLSRESNTETPLPQEPIDIKREESNTEDPLFDSSPIAKRRRVQHSTIPNRQLEEEYCTKDESNCGDRENEENDKECELYGQLLVTKLKPLDVDDRLVLMNEIDNLVFKYLLKIRRRSKLSNDKPGTSSRPY